MKNLTNGKHGYPPKKSSVEYRKDDLWTWEIKAALTIQFSGGTLSRVFRCFLKTISQAAADTSIHKEWNVNVDLEEWTPAELYFLTINNMSETIRFSFIEKYGLHLIPGHPE